MAEIRRLDSGKLLARAVVGYKGKRPIRVSKTFPKNTKQVTIEEWEHDAKAKGVTRKVPKNFDALIQEFLNYKKSQVAARTHKGYERDFRLYICGRLSKVEDISTDDLQDVLNEFLHLSPRTLQLIKLLLSMVLDYAVLKDYIDKSPMNKSVTIPKQRRSRRIEVLSIEDFERLRDTLTEHNEVGLLTLLLSGVRLSELLALQSRHIQGNSLRIDSALDNSDGVRQVGECKSEHSYRTISIPENLAVMLSENASNKFLIELGATGLRKRLRKYCDLLGLPQMSLHALRHSHCTYLLANKVNVMAVSKRLGHHNAAFTLSRYAHLVPSMESELMSVLG